MLGRTYHQLRQRRHPVALRIAPPGLVEPGLGPAGVDDLLAWLTAGDPAPPPSPPSAEPAPPPPSAGLDGPTLARLATAAWRLEKQVHRLGDEGHAPFVRNRLEILMRLFEGEGLEIQDYSGRPFDDGEIWDEVVGGAHLSGPLQIADMREPRIRLRGVLLQNGTPILGPA